MKAIFIAICIGIALAVTVGVGFVISAYTAQSDQVTINNGPDGQNFAIELKENVNAYDSQNP